MAKGIYRRGNIFWVAYAGFKRAVVIGEIREDQPRRRNDPHLDIDALPGGNLA